jgi:hypothetical protein
MSGRGTMHMVGLGGVGKPGVVYDVRPIIGGKSAKIIPSPIDADDSDEYIYGTAILNPGWQISSTDGNIRFCNDGIVEVVKINSLLLVNKPGTPRTDTFNAMFIVSGPQLTESQKREKAAHKARKEQEKAEQQLRRAMEEKEQVLQAKIRSLAGGRQSSQAGPTVFNGGNYFVQQADVIIDTEDEESGRPKIESWNMNVTTGIQRTVEKKSDDVYMLVPPVEMLIHCAKTLTIDGFKFHTSSSTGVWYDNGKIYTSDHAPLQLN